MNEVFGFAETLCFFVFPFVGLAMSIIWALAGKKSGDHSEGGDA